MTRFLLSLALLAAQLASWNASPRYLCRGEDGTTCIDLGPAACDCCRHETLAFGPAGPCDSHDENGACPDGPGSDHNLSDREAVIAFDSCGCQHVQLSEVQQATLDRAASSPDSHRVLKALVPADPGAGAASSTTMPGFLIGHDLGSRGKALAERAGVVMRC